MVARSEIDQNTALSADPWGGKGLNPQAARHVDKFLTSINLNLTQVKDFGSRVREICQGKGQEVPEGLPSNLVGLFLCARELYPRSFVDGENAMTKFLKIYDKLSTPVKDSLRPGIDIIKKEVPIPPVDPKRVIEAGVVYGDAPNAAGYPYEKSS